MASLVANQNRQSILFADNNLNINTKGWKAEYVPSEAGKPLAAPPPLKLAPLPPLQSAPAPTITVQPTAPPHEEVQDEEEVYSPIEAKPMPQRLGGPPLEAQLVKKIQPPPKQVNIPIQRLDESQPASTPDHAAIEAKLNENCAASASNAVDFTKEFMAELMGGPVPPPGAANIPGGEEFTKNFVSQLMEGSLTPAMEVLVTQPAAKSEPAAKSIWDSAPVQPRKPCKKPQEQAEWEAILNANLAGMAENEEEFTKDFMANLLGGQGGAKSGPVPSGTGAILNTNPGGVRAATPPALRSVPKAPTCWVCAEPVIIGAKILKIKGYPMHPECFVCTSCNVPLKSSSVFISNERLFCREHIKFGPGAIKPASRPTSRPSSRPNSMAPEFTEL